MSAAERMTWRPVAVEPVKTILSMPGWTAMAAPMFTLRSSPETALSTPAGRTALASSIMRSVARG